MRIACRGLIYRKLLRLRKSTAEFYQNENILNLLSNDVGKFDAGLISLHEVWKGPLQAIVFLVVIYMEIGVSGVIGMICLLSVIPFQGNNKMFIILSIE